MHLDLSHGKWPVEWNGKEAGAVELSWIQPLYCLQHTAHFPLANPSELDLSKDSVEDRYLRIRKDCTRIRSHLLFNPRSDILQNSSDTPNSMI